MLPRTTQTRAMNKSFTTLALLLALTAPAWADDASAPSALSLMPPAAQRPGPDPRDVPVIAKIVDQGYAPTYVERWNGYDVWAFLGPDGPRILYSSLDGSNLFWGIVYDADHQPVTAHHVALARKQYGLPDAAPIAAAGGAAPSTAGAPTGTVAAVAPPSNAAKPPSPTAAPTIAPKAIAPTAAPAAQPAQSPAESHYAQLRQARTIDFGPATAPEIFVFVDPRCPYCKDLFSQLQAGPLRQNAVRLHLVPVALLDDPTDKAPESAALAIGLLAAQDRSQVWTDFMAGAPVPALSKVTSDDLYRLAFNSAVAQNWKVDRVPTLVWRSTAGKIRYQAGVPQNLAALIADAAPAN